MRDIIINDREMYVENNRCKIFARKPDNTFTISRSLHFCYQCKARNTQQTRVKFYISSKLYRVDVYVSIFSAYRRFRILRSTLTIRKKKKKNQIVLAS